MPLIDGKIDGVGETIESLGSSVARLMLQDSREKEPRVEQCEECRLLGLYSACFKCTKPQPNGFHCGMLFTEEESQKIKRKQEREYAAQMAHHVSKLIIGTNVVKLGTRFHVVCYR